MKKKNFLSKLYFGPYALTGERQHWFIGALKRFSAWYSNLFVVLIINFLLHFSP